MTCASKKGHEVAVKWAYVKRIQQIIMPRVPKCSRAALEFQLSGHKSVCCTHQQQNWFRPYQQHSWGCVDVLKNDKSKLATLENLLKTVLEKVAQKKKNFLLRLQKLGLARTRKRDPHRHHTSCRSEDAHSTTNEKGSSFSKSVACRFRPQPTK